MKFILGKKIEMTQIWQGDQMIPATRLAVGPCVVLQIKDQTTDGYQAVQVGYGFKKAKNISKTQIGHNKGLGNFLHTREFRIDNYQEVAGLKVGDVISAETLAVGDKLKIKGIAKGKGFQGVVKRYGFHGQDKTHGNKDQLRSSGSVGAGGVQHVFKGTRMSGRVGGESITVKDVEVLQVNPELNEVLVKGQVPGSRNSLVLISGEGELRVGSQESGIKNQESEIVENPEIENVEVKSEEIKSEPEVVEVAETKPEEVAVDPEINSGQENTEAKPEEIVAVDPEMPQDELGVENSGQENVETNNEEVK